MSDGISNNIKLVLMKYILADAQDLRAQFQTDPYPLLETYENYTTSKLKKSPYVKINTDVIAFLTKLFQKISTEAINSLDQFANGVDQLTIIDNCNDQSICTYMSKVHVSINQTLALANDPTNYWQIKLASMIKSTDIANVLANLFDQYLKKIAAIISRYIWYNHATISLNIFMGLLMATDFTPELALCMQ